MSNNIKASVMQETNNGKKYFEKYYELPSISEEGRKDPFLNTARGENNPSAICHISKNGICYLKDFGDDSWSGDMFHHYSMLHDLDLNTDFGQICKGIYQYMTGEEFKYELNKKSNVKVLDSYNWESDVKIKVIPIVKSKWTNAHLNFLKEHNIDPECFESNDACFLSKYVFWSTKKEKTYEITCTNDQIVIAYKLPNGFKIYKPHDSKFKFASYGETGDYLFGLELLEKSIYRDKMLPDHMIIAAGEKDTMILQSMGYNAVCLASETYTRPDGNLAFQELVKIIKEAEINRTIILYDLDKAGIKSRHELACCLRRYDLKARFIDLPKELEKAGGKDVADMIKLGFKCELKKLIEETLDFIENEESFKLPIKPEVPPPINKINANERLKDMAEKMGSVNKTPEENGTNKEEGMVDIQLSAKSKSNLIHKEGKIQFNDIVGSQFQFGEKVYKDLPKFFRSFLDLKKEQGIKDILLLSLITAVGSCFPNVFSYYGPRKIHPFLYVFVNARPASGKSAITVAKRITMPVHKQIEGISEVVIQAFKKQMNNDKTLKKEDCPKKKGLFLAGDSSYSSLLLKFEKNNGVGLMVETEADTITNVNQQEWGGQDNLFRQAFEHEFISQSRITDEREIEIFNPKLAIVVSGTNNQFKRFIKSDENGSFSRFIFYHLNSSKIFKVGKRQTAIKTIDFIKTRSQEMLEIYNQIKENNQIEVIFTDDQIDRLEEQFQHLLDTATTLENTTLDGTVKRLGDIVCRISQVLTIVRAYEKSSISQEITCNNNDFEIAMTIALIAFNHSCRSLKLLRGDATLLLDKRQLELYKSLPATFTSSEYYTAAEKHKISNNTSSKWLSKHSKVGIFEKECHGKYSKTNQQAI